MKNLALALSVVFALSTYGSVSLACDKEGRTASADSAKGEKSEKEKAKGKEASCKGEKGCSGEKGKSDEKSTEKDKAKGGDMACSASGCTGAK